MNLSRGFHGPLLIAEIGGNHEGDFDSALRLADIAIEAHVDAVKFQIYSGDTLVSVRESPERNAHFKKFELTPSQHLALADRILAAGCAYVASVWDLEAFAWIDPVVSAYKIGSGDLTAPPFLRAAAATGKPIILSTGLSDMAEVEAAVDYLRSCRPIYRDPSMLAVLQCTSMYPITPPDAHLSVMQAFSTLSATVGYSDHTIGWRALEVAAAMGAQILEFHFTDQKQGRSFRDHQLSLDGEDLRSLVRALDEISVLKGVPEKRPLPIEIENNHLDSFRRAVYPARAIEIGEVLTEHNLCVLRPNHGIDAREYYQLLGRRARRRLLRHEQLDWQDIE
ncbi:MAG: N-acetylneuraminate synthase family protein [Verrucomicrobiota bacterium]